MSDSAKNYAKNVLDGYNETLMRLAKRYSTAISDIDTEHDAVNREIGKKANKEKSMADMSNKVTLKNIQRGLLDKGLSRSGASVQAELDSNLARNTAFSGIDENASKERAANETARAKSKSAILVELINSINTAELKKNEAYISQLNADRAYAAERDDEKFDRYAENRAYEAERDDEKFDRYAENRAYEAERDDEKFDRYAENRAYEAERDDEKFDRYAENRAYEAERDDEKFDRYAENRAYEAERDDENYDRYADQRDYLAERDDEKFDRYAENREYEADRDDEKHDRYMESQENAGGEIITADGITVSSSGDKDAGVDPRISPKEFVDKIKLVHNSKYYETNMKRTAAIRKAIEKIIIDPTLSLDYRYQVKIYAEAIGAYTSKPTDTETDTYE